MSVQLLRLRAASAALGRSGGRAVWILLSKLLQCVPWTLFFLTDPEGRWKENNDIHNIRNNIFYVFKGTFVWTN